MDGSGSVTCGLIFVRTGLQHFALTVNLIAARNEKNKKREKKLLYHSEMLSFVPLARVSVWERGSYIMYQCPSPFTAPAESNQINMVVFTLIEKNPNKIKGDFEEDLEKCIRCLQPSMDLLPVVVIKLSVNLDASEWMWIIYFVTTAL